MMPICAKALVILAFISCAVTCIVFMLFIAMRWMNAGFMRPQL